LQAKLERFGIETIESVGVGYNLLTQGFRITDDPSVNYMSVVVRPPAPQLHLV